MNERPPLADRRLLPVAEVAVASMVLVIAGGIYMAAHLPARPPLGLAEVLTGLGGAGHEIGTAGLGGRAKGPWREGESELQYGAWR